MERDSWLNLNFAAGLLEHAFCHQPQQAAALSGQLLAPLLRSYDQWMQYDVVAGIIGPVGDVKLIGERIPVDQVVRVGSRCW